MEQNTTASSNNDHVHLYIGLASIMVTSLVLAISLNALHLVVLCRSPRLFNENLRLCLRLLAVIDMLGGLLSYGRAALFIILILRHSDSVTLVYANLLICNIIAGTFVLLMWSSQVVLLVVTIERYVAVTRPLRYYAVFTRRRTVGVLLLALLGGLAVTVARSTHSIRVGYCDFDDQVGSSLLRHHPVIAVYSVIPFVIVIAVTTLNVHILCIVKRHKKRDAALRRKCLALQNNNSSAPPAGLPGPRRSFSEECKSVIPISAVVAASYVTWTPYLVVAIASVNKDINFPAEVVFLISWLCYSTFWHNPIILGAVSRHYRHSVSHLFKSLTVVG